MTMEECYSRMGADYSEVLRRLEKEERIERFLNRFLNEESYELLCRALKDQNAEEAFRAAHSLKGVCMNLGLTPLFHSADRLTEELRSEKISQSVQPLIEQVTKDYQLVIQTIQDYLKDKILNGGSTV